MMMCSVYAIPVPSIYKCHCLLTYCFPITSQQSDTDQASLEWRCPLTAWGQRGQRHYRSRRSTDLSCNLTWSEFSPDLTHHITQSLPCQTTVYVHWFLTSLPVFHTVMLVQSKRSLGTFRLKPIQPTISNEDSITCTKKNTCGTD